ncbi:MAG TPA: hypothetical protein VM238_13010 [Phycisphaerae bacterium]|nr:hypothetical protein [Phycisphaerae bacterium]
MKPLREPLRAKTSVAGTAAVGAAAAAALAAARSSAAEPSKPVADVLDQLPADDYETAGKLCTALLDGGPVVVTELVNLVGDEFGDPGGVKPKYALHGLVHYASRPGVEKARAMLAETLAAELAAEHSDELKAFIVRQLQLCGRTQEIAALAKLLASDRLCNPATQALVAIGGPSALKALRDALPTAEGPRQVAISQAVELLSRK